ncbi:MAG: hypothetical protein WCE82_10870 [Halobacteriota archaeon]
MRKTLVALVLCAVLVSTMSLTSVVSARQASNSANQGGVGFIIAAIYKFWQSKLNPTQIPIGTPIALLVALVKLAMQNVVS